MADTSAVEKRKLSYLNSYTFQSPVGIAGRAFYGKQLSIPLDFLQDGTTYEVTCYEDLPETHYIHNREAYQIRSGQVTSGDSIEARLAPGGGHCMWIRPTPTD